MQQVLEWQTVNTKNETRQNREYNLSDKGGSYGCYDLTYMTSALSL